MKEIIKNIILENQNTELPVIIERDIQIPVNQNIIISLIGARRSGKTYILYQTIKKLVENGISNKYILFINFEDERLNLNSENLDYIIQSYQELFPEIKIKDAYLFFDEIQNISGWEKFIRRIFDTKTRNIFLTGSNSKLLSSEIATELRGRTITYTVFPLNFKEFLKFNNTQPLLYPQKNKSKIINLAHKYLTEGSFPESLNFNGIIKNKLLQQYFNVMIFRDIIERYHVSNIETLKFFVKKIFANVTKPLSINKIYNELRSLGYSISNKYLYEFLDYCNSVFLIQNINKFNYSEIKQEKSDKKTYVIDNGLISAIEFSVSQNMGKLFENMVAMEFIKNNKKIFYFKNNFECDFIVDDNHNYLPVQASFAFADNETKNREIRALIEACNYINSNNGTIITFDTEENIVYDGIKVTIVPFYKYFL
ncbi:MAG TPA: ATP-binding protein [Bacteroidales bacterium]|nr:ATP-binding protein [Bacteroidales bacterium]